MTKELKIRKSIASLILILLMGGKIASAQEIENNFKIRTATELSFEPFKNVKLNFIPELRFEDAFSLDKYLLEGEAVYKPVKFLSLAASYRFVADLKETKDTEYFNRFAFSATAKKEFKNFESAFRLRYTNDSDDENSNEDFFRYKASLKYDIPKSKITPFLAIEAFQRLSDGDLYKMRYSAGVDYKLFKKNYIGLSYKLDYYQKEYKNNHILSVGYKIKF